VGVRKGQRLRDGLRMDCNQGLRLDARAPPRYAGELSHNISYHLAAPYHVQLDSQDTSIHYNEETDWLSFIIIMEDNAKHVCPIRAGNLQHKGRCGEIHTLRAAYQDWYPLTRGWALREAFETGGTHGHEQ
jgi:hypothetical protein